LRIKLVTNENDRTVPNPSPETPQPEARPEKKSGKSVFSVIYDSLASVTLAIFLLIILAVTSIFGTVILQKGDPEQYLMEYGPGMYKLFQFLALDDMYRSWWFLTILVLLLANITTCSIKRFPRAWRLMTQSPKVLDDALFKRMKHRGSIRRGIDPESAVDEARDVIEKHYGKVRETREESSVTLYVDKGWYGRLGAYIVHLSILILAIGAVYGGIMGFKGYVAIVEGTAVDRVPVRGKNTVMKLPFVVQCDEFQVEYYPNSQQVKDYYSDLTVFRDGQVEMKKRIEVNHPLIVDGIYFYQSSYGVDRNSTVTLQVLDPVGNIAGPDVTVAAGQDFQVMGDPKTYQIEEFITNATAGRPGVKVAQFLGNSHNDFYLLEAAPDRDKSNRRGPVYFRIKSTNIKEYTGLQVAWDPGVPVVWLACTVMMLGLYIAFFVAHLRIWVRVDLDSDDTAVLIAGTSNRNPATFEREFENALSDLKDALKAKKG
jgi:cytochrome c biogenesis protein